MGAIKLITGQQTEQENEQKNESCEHFQNKYMKYQNDAGNAKDEEKAKEMIKCKIGLIILQETRSKAN